MYNYSLKLTYNESDSDTIYRKELLEAFKLKEYDFNKITGVLDEEIMPLVKQYFDPVFESLNKHNRFPFALDKHICSTILLSWEYFYLFHNCVGEIYQKNNDKITTSIKTLISAIEKQRNH